MKYEIAEPLREECRDLIDSQLTIQSCERIIEIIKLLAEDDDEVAHSLEDDFRDAVLKQIDHPLAKLALKTSKIGFSRWYA